MDDNTLPQVIHGLARIETAGLLPDLILDFAAERRGWPANDLHGYPLRAPRVERIASAVSKLTAWPLELCRAAACEALLPDTRLRLLVRLIERYLDRIDGEPATQQSAVPAVIANANASAAPHKTRRRKGVRCGS
jgi:hypothetical protein